MAHRIEVGFKPSVRDAWGEKIKKRIWEDLHYQADAVAGIAIYTVDMDLSPDQLTLIAEGPLVDPIIQQYTVDKPLAQGFDWMLRWASGPELLIMWGELPVRPSNSFWKIS